VTAEIAILNKLGVALAADSAVTVETEGGQKIYNTVNKLFTSLGRLSRLLPIASNWLDSGEVLIRALWRAPSQA
jgi:hypothetical protein